MSKSNQVKINVTPEMLIAIDAWRRRRVIDHSEILSRPEAIRRMVSESLGGVR